MLGGHSSLDPPLPISNRTVKRVRANDSVHPHAKVGHRQAPYLKALDILYVWGFCFGEHKNGEEFYLSTAKIAARKLTTSLNCISLAFVFCYNPQLIMGVQPIFCLCGERDGFARITGIHFGWIRL